MGEKRWPKEAGTDKASLCAFPPFASRRNDGGRRGGANPCRNDSNSNRNRTQRHPLRSAAECFPYMYPPSRVGPLRPLRRGAALAVLHVEEKIFHPPPLREWGSQNVILLFSSHPAISGSLTPSITALLREGAGIAGRTASPWPHTCIRIPGNSLPRARWRGVSSFDDTKAKPGRRRARSSIYLTVYKELTVFPRMGLMPNRGRQLPHRRHLELLGCGYWTLLPRLAHETSPRRRISLAPKPRSISSR